MRPSPSSSLQFGLASLVLAAVLVPGADAQRRLPRSALPTPVPPSASVAYVANASSGTVSVVDVQTNLVTATVQVGASPSRIAVAPGGARVYVANTVGDSLSVIDTSSNTVVATIPALDGPASLAVTPDGARVYVGGLNGIVGVVDTATNTMTSSFTIGAPAANYSVTDLFVSPDGTRAYATWGEIVVIDTATNLVTNTIYAGNNVTCAALSADGTKLLAGAQFGYGTFGFYGTVAVVDTASAAVSNVINVWGLPYSLAISPDGTRGYVATPWTWSDTGYGAGYLSSPWVSRLDLTSNALAGGLNAGSPARGLAYTPDGAGLYVAVPGSNALKRVDTSSNTVTASILVGSSPIGVAVRP